MIRAGKPGLTEMPLTSTSRSSAADTRFPIQRSPEIVDGERLPELLGEPRSSTMARLILPSSVEEGKGADPRAPVCCPPPSP